MDKANIVKAKKYEARCSTFFISFVLLYICGQLKWLELCLEKSNDNNLSCFVKKGINLKTVEFC